MFPVMSTERRMNIFVYINLIVYVTKKYTITFQNGIEHRQKRQNQRKILMISTYHKDFVKYLTHGNRKFCPSKKFLVIVQLY